MIVPPRDYPSTGNPNLRLKGTGDGNPLVNTALGEVPMRANLLGYQPCIIAIVVLHVVGCSSRQVALSPEETNLAQLSRLYGVYIGKHRGQAPRDIETLKAFAKANSRDELKARGVTAEHLDEIFISSRDKLAFGYLPPKTTGGVPGVGVEDVVFYEQVGAGGKRYVAYSTPGKVEEIDESRFKQLAPGAL